MWCLFFDQEMRRRVQIISPKFTRVTCLRPSRSSIMHRSMLKPFNHIPLPTKSIISLSLDKVRLSRSSTSFRLTVQMIGRATRAAAPAISRRTFTSTRAQLASPFHYPEGPRSNLPFNPNTKFFAIRYWTFMSRRCTEKHTIRD